MIYDFVSPKCDKAFKRTIGGLIFMSFALQNYLLKIRILNGGKRLVKIPGLKCSHISVWKKKVILRKASI